jgi:hypothetical protein
LCTQYFSGSKEVARIYEETHRNKIYYNVLVSRYWNLFHSSSCSCGEPKDVTIRVTTGLSKESYDKSDSEIGSNLGFGLVSISSRLSKESGESLKISREQTVEDKTTYRAPECGKKSIDIYQLFTKWHIEQHNHRGIFKKKLDVKYIDFEVGESQWHTDYKVLEQLPECGCRQQASYNGTVMLDARNATITLPCNISGDKIVIYGIKNKSLSKGNVIKVNELPIELPKFLDLISEDAEIVTVTETEQKYKQHQEKTIKNTSNTSGLGYPDWHYLFQEKKVMPFIGGVYNGLYRKIAQDWALRYNYPLEDSDDLPMVAQFLEVEYYTSFPKREMSQIIQEQPIPNFFEEGEPHRALADLDLPVYVTTNYDDFMVRALESQGKKPTRDFCRWNGLENITEVKSPLEDDNFQPSPENPLVRICCIATFYGLN